MFALNAILHNNGGQKYDKLDRPIHACIERSLDFHKNGNIAV